MGWRVEGGGRRYVEVTADGVDADLETLDTLTSWRGRPVPYGHPGEAYEPTEAADPVWVYLAALQAIPGPHTVTGSPPRMPSPPAADYPAGAVF